MEGRCKRQVLNGRGNESLSSGGKGYNPVRAIALSGFLPSKLPKSLLSTDIQCFNWKDSQLPLQILLHKICPSSLLNPYHYLCLIIINALQIPRLSLSTGSSLCFQFADTSSSPPSSFPRPPKPWRRRVVSSKIPRLSLGIQYFDYRSAQVHPLFPVRCRSWKQGFIEHYLYLIIPPHHLYLILPPSSSPQTHPSSCPSNSALPRTGGVPSGVQYHNPQSGSSRCWEWLRL